MAEKLLQQTSASHVMKVYGSFFQQFPDFKALNDSSLSDIENAIKPLGFWRIRARDFKKMASHMLDMRCVVPSTKDELESIPGVGSYVSAAVVCFCFGGHQAIVDVNVRRVMKRLFFWSTKLPRDEVLEKMWLEVIPNGKAKECNWGILDFSAMICTRNPRCSMCFAKDICDFYLNELDKGKSTANFSKNVM